MRSPGARKWGVEWRVLIRMSNEVQLYHWLTVFVTPPKPSTHTHTLYIAYAYCILLDSSWQKLVLFHFDLCCHGLINTACEKFILFCFYTVTMLLQCEIVKEHHVLFFFFCCVTHCCRFLAGSSSSICVCTPSNTGPRMLSATDLPWCTKTSQNLPDTSAAIMHCGSHVEPKTSLKHLPAQYQKQRSDGNHDISLEDYGGGFMTCCAAHHQGASERLCLHFVEALMTSIFIYCSVKNGKLCASSLISIFFFIFLTFKCVRS